MPQTQGFETYLGRGTMNNTDLSSHICGLPLLDSRFVRDGHNPHYYRAINLLRVLLAHGVSSGIRYLHGPKPRPPFGSAGREGCLGGLEHGDERRDIVFPSLNAIGSRSVETFPQKHFRGYLAASELCREACSPNG